MEYPIVEIFTSLQGEGLYTGTPMTFFRVQGCSVGKTICNYCDTDFESVNSWRGGRIMSHEDIIDYAQKAGVSHICLTGGEPLDYDWSPLFDLLADLQHSLMVHIETSGTVAPEWLKQRHVALWANHHLWITACPKPGWTPDAVDLADEIKVIAGGTGLSAPHNTKVLRMVGEGQSGWPTLEQAVEWSKDRLVYIQPKNDKHTPDRVAMQQAIQTCLAHPSLRLSAQFHKYLGVA